MSAKLQSLVLALAASASVAHGQLGITEIASAAATNLGPALVIQHSDYWELSNFGTNTADLTGYRWNDNAGGLIGADPTPFSGITIQPGESIIFFESISGVVTNADQFREWWGLAPSVRCFPYTGNGLSSTGDGVILWTPSAMGNDDFVDRVDFLEAARGQSFVYNPATGIFDPGLFSTNGVAGAFKAVTTDDVGSPGTNTGPVVLAITEQPTNAAVNPGDTAIFKVVASGLPRPKYQWQFNGTDIAGARSSTLFVTNALTDDVGQYRVIVSNGADPLMSDSAALSLNSMPEPPQLLTALENKNLFIGQSASLTVVASGVPQPTYQWHKNGANIAGATANSYAIAGAQVTDTAVYSVIVANALGSLTNQATLTVTRRPRLVVTEIMPAQSTNGPHRGHNDWWELTNLDDFTVDLSGYRFDDSSATLLAAVTITNQGLMIAPGQSIVFVESMSSNSFVSWWGPQNMKGVTVVRYAGAGLSLSSLGDAIVLWNGGATEDADTISTEVFSTATNGVSFGFDPNTEIFGDPSQIGINGAFIAPENGDIGSPGFLRNIPEARLLNILKAGPGYRVTFIGTTGRTYTLQRAADVNGPWTDITPEVTAAVPVVTAEDSTGGAGEQRFYRVKTEP